MIARSVLSAVLLLASASGVSAQTIGGNASAQPAQPQAQPLGGPVIAGVCLLSREAIFANAAVGRAASARLQELTQQAQAEIDAQRAPLESEARSLEGQPDNAQNQQRREQLAGRWQALQQQAAHNSHEIEATRAAALERIANDAQPVIAQVYGQHDCGLLFDRNSALGGNFANDLTPGNGQEERHACGDRLCRGRLRGRRGAHAVVAGKAADVVRNHRNRLMSNDRNCTFLRRLSRWCVALAGAGIAATAPAAGQTVSPSAAPVEWVRYAETATSTISGWLSDDSEAATQFRAYLDRTRPADDQPSPPLELRIWVDPGGAVSRIDFTPFVHEEANAHLRSAVVGRRLPPPPSDMLLPLRIAIQLDAPQPVAPAPTRVNPPQGDSGASLI